MKLPWKLVVFGSVCTVLWFGLVYWTGVYHPAVPISDLAIRQVSGGAAELEPLQRFDLVKNTIESVGALVTLILVVVLWRTRRRSLTKWPRPALPLL